MRVDSKVFSKSRLAQAGDTHERGRFVKVTPPDIAVNKSSILGSGYGSTFTALLAVTL